MFLLLSDADTAEIMKDCKDVTTLTRCLEEQMNGFVVFPKTVYSNDKVFAEYLDKSVKYVSSLPLKYGKKRYTQS